MGDAEPVAGAGPVGPLDAEAAHPEAGLLQGPAGGLRRDLPHHRLRARADVGPDRGAGPGAAALGPQVAEARDLLKIGADVLDRPRRQPALLPDEARQGGAGDQNRRERGDAEAPQVPQGQDDGGQRRRGAQPGQPPGDLEGEQRPARLQRQQSGPDPESGEQDQQRRGGRHDQQGLHKPPALRRRPRHRLSPRPSGGGSPSVARAAPSCRSCPWLPAGCRRRRPRRRASTIWRSCPAGSRGAPACPGSRPA